MTATVKGWIETIERMRQKGNENGVKIFYFVFLWASYNDFYRELYPELRYDWEAVLKLYEDDRAKGIYAGLKSKFLCSFTKNNRNCVVDIRPNPKPPAFYKTGQDSLKDFLGAVYQIRCNFFHGDKDPYNPEDIRLIVWAYECLSEFLSKVDEERFPRI
jgi:hypothetical protein